MKTVNVDGVSSPYEVIVSNNCLQELPQKLKMLTNAVNIGVITDDKVDKLYSEKVIKILNDSGYRTCKFVFEHGEKSKNLNTVSNILEFLAENNLTRSDCLAALGGGITGDITGFASAAFLRGIDFVQLPTTLLAAVDSSVGGKTGVNLEHGKNLAGAFHQPRLVICDTDTFKTLPKNIFSEGIAEAVKYGVICDKQLFKKFNNGIDSNIEEIVARCVQIKADIVSRDEFDTGERQLLNFGHTFAHGIEKLSDFKISHGYAVGIGMVMISRAAYKLGLSDYDCSEPIISVLEKNNIPVSFECSVDALLNIIMQDKKRKGDTITLVLPKEIGKCYLHKINCSELRKFIEKAFEV